MWEAWHGTQNPASGPEALCHECDARQTEQNRDFSNLLGPSGTQAPNLDLLQSREGP